MSLWVTVDELRDRLGVPATVVPDDTLDGYCQAASDLVSAYLAAGVDPTTPAVRLAALHVAVDLWQASSAAGGEPVAVDYMPGPYRMGRSLMSTVAGLIAPYRSAGSLVG